MTDLKQRFVSKVGSFEIFHAITKLKSSIDFYIKSKTARDFNFKLFRHY